jgi:hypothetical protein
MTNHDWHVAKKVIKDTAKGVHAPKPRPPPTQPCREGLWGVKYAFSNTEAPRLVVPRDPGATQPKTVAIPRLEGQEGVSSTPDSFLLP